MSTITQSDFVPTLDDWYNAALILRDGIICLCVAIYLAGLYTGRFVHTANAWLAMRWPTKPPVYQPKSVVATLSTTDRTVRIKNLRNKMEWSQQRIADYIGCSRTTVRRALMA